MARPPSPRISRLPRPREIETVRRTAHLVRRADSAPVSEAGTLSRQARKLVRRHADQSRDELPEWAYRDLLAALGTAEALERQLDEARGRLAQLVEALKIAGRLAAEAEVCLARTDVPVAQA